MCEKQSMIKHSHKKKRHSTGSENVSYRLSTNDIRIAESDGSHNRLVRAHTQQTKECELTPDEPNGVSSHFTIKSQKSAESENNTYMGLRRFRTIGIKNKKEKIDYFRPF